MENNTYLSAAELEFLRGLAELTRRTGVVISAEEALFYDMGVDNVSITDQEAGYTWHQLSLEWLSVHECNKQYFENYKGHIVSGARVEDATDDLPK